MIRRLALAFALLALAGCNGKGGTAVPSPTPAPSYPGAALLAQAQAAAAAGNVAQAQSLMDQALLAMDAAAPLRIEHLTVVEDSVRGFGIYTPIADGTIPAGKPLILYFEPGAFCHGSTGTGDDTVYGSDLAADLIIVSANGTVLQQEPDFLSSKITSRRPNREVQFQLRLASGEGPAGIPEGDYLARIVLHDKLCNKQASADIPFKVRIKK
jgi:hypothetical protein